MCEQTIAVLWFKSIILLSLRIILIFTTPSLRFFWRGGGDGGRAHHMGRNSNSFNIFGRGVLFVQHRLTERKASCIFRNDIFAHDLMLFTYQDSINRGTTFLL